MTNATKAQIIVAINSLFALGQAFHVVLTAPQLAASQVAVNAVLSLFVGATYEQSAKRADGTP